MAFVKTTRDNLLIGARCYRIGSVVEVDDDRAAELLKEGHATADPGPASEPEPEDDEDDAPATKKPKKTAPPVQTATLDLKAKLEQATAQGSK